jgi:hypothetical protein
MLPPLCGLREAEGRVLRQSMMAQSWHKNAFREDCRRWGWPAITSKLNDNTCDSLLPQNFTTPAYDGRNNSVILGCSASAITAADR